MKKSGYSKPYLIVEADSGSIEVYNFFENVKESLRQVADLKSFPVDPAWTTRQLGSKICKEFGNGKAAIIDNHAIFVEKSGAIVTFMKYENTKGALREVAEKIGFSYDTAWTTRQFGSKLINELNNNK